MGSWLQDRSFVEKMSQCQEAITIGNNSVQGFHIHSENIVQIFLGSEKSGAMRSV